MQAHARLNTIVYPFRDTKPSYPLELCTYTLPFRIERDTESERLKENGYIKKLVLEKNCVLNKKN